MLSLLLLLALPLLTAPLATPTPTLLSKVSSYLAYRSDFYASNANPTPSSEPFPTVLKGTTDNAFLTANSFKPKPITSPAFTEPFFTNQTFIDFQEMLDLGYSDLANEIVKAQVPCFELYKALNLPSPSLTAPIPEMNSGPLFLPDETTTDLGLSLGSSLEDQLVSDQFPKPPPPPPSPTQKVYPKLPPQQTPNWSPAQLDKQGRLAGRAQSWAFEQKRAAPKSNLAPHDIVLPSSTIVMTNGRQLYFQLFMLLGALGFGRGGHGLVEYAHTGETHEGSCATRHTTATINRFTRVTHALLTRLV